MIQKYNNREKSSNKRKREKKKMKEFYEFEELKEIINIHQKMNIKNLSIHINHHMNSRKFYYEDIYEIEISFEEISDLKFYLMNEEFHNFIIYINELNYFDIFKYFQSFYEDKEIEIQYIYFENENELNNFIIDNMIDLDFEIKINKEYYIENIEDIIFDII